MAASYTDVAEAVAVHVVRMELVAAVDEECTVHPGAQGVEVRLAEVFPFGDEDERVGAIQLRDRKSVV